MGRPNYLFLTGKLAAAPLRQVVSRLANSLEFDYAIETLPITVAALLTTDWIARRLPQIEPTDRVILPGYTRGELAVLESLWGVPVERGPKDLRQLPRHFGQHPQADERLGAYDIDIIAEINHAPRWERQELLATARRLADDGADVIDLGCDPGSIWNGVGEAVRAVRDLGLRVSVDSLSPDEIRAAVNAGAELVLSLNSSNRFLAEELEADWVLIPDEPAGMSGLDETIDFVASTGQRFRIDPILEPIGLGFAASLGRYLEARRRWPDVEIMMGVGNLTELTDVDSAGVNTLLLGFCQELGIRSVLTTQVINWAQSSVRECDLARRLTHYACQMGVPPKRVDEQLVVLRDAAVLRDTPDEIAALSQALKDANYRVFVSEQALHLAAHELNLSDQDPFALFDQLLDTKPSNIDASHAFYLGYELCKAEMARLLGKNYRQDESLQWGHLTVDEPDRHRLSRRREAGTDNGPPTPSVRPADAPDSTDEDGMSGESEAPR